MLARFRSFRIPLNKPVLYCLLAADAALILAHVLLGLVVDRIPLAFNIAADRSLGEFHGYAKWLAIALILCCVRRRRSLPLLVPFAAIFLVALVDDALQLHERLGTLIADGLGLNGLGSLRGQDFGELAAFALIGAALLPLLALGAVKSRAPERMVFVPLLILVALLATLGIAVDFLHSLVSGIPFGPQVFDLIEDGGELVVASLIVAHVVTLFSSAPPSHPVAA